MMSHRTPLTLLALLVPLTAPTARSDDKPAFTKDSFVSGGKKIRVELFEPATKGKHPAVLFFHGVDALHAGNEGPIRAVARRVADKGVVVLIVRFYDRTGTQEKDMDGLLKQLQTMLQQGGKCPPKEDDLSRLFKAWTEVVRDSLAHARKMDRVDGERVALIGLSLGGYLAASVAAEKDQKVSAIVTLFSGIPPEVAKSLLHFPPALILAGDMDRVVPHQESLNLRDLLKLKKLRCSCKVYEEVGHCFKDGLLAAVDAEDRISTFLHQHLKIKAQE